MIQKIYAIWIYVNNIQESIDFYEGILEMKFKLREEDWIEFDLDGTSFAILQRQPKQGPLKPQKMRTMFQVNDIEKMKAKFLDNNVKLIGDIREEKYGKVLTFEDPNGHWLELFEPIE